MIVIEAKWGDGKWRPERDRCVFADDHADKAKERIEQLKRNYAHHYQSPPPEFRLVYCRRVGVVKEIKSVK